jgi:hypothetical protein
MFGADAVEPHDVGPPHQPVQRGLRAGREHITARREHHVVVQVVGQVPPQRHRVLVEGRVLLHHVVGAHDRGVAPDIAGADVALLQDRDIADAVVLGKVVRGGQPVPTAADDHDVVMLLRLRVAPGALPALVAAHRMLEQRPGRVTLRHGPTSSCAAPADRRADPSAGGPAGARPGSRSPAADRRGTVPSGCSPAPATGRRNGRSRRR